MNEKFLEVLKYLFLSLLQGITEVLPVSSSGHLQIASEVLKIKDNTVTLSVFLHLASLLAVVVYLRKDLIELIKGFFGVDDAVPVEGEAHAAELAGEFFNVSVGQLTGMDARLDGGILGGQTEGVKANGEQDVVALHPSLAADDLQTRVGLDVAHVHTHARGVGELYEAVELGLVTVILGTEDFGVVPTLLPFCFNGGKIVLHDYILSS